MNHPAFPFYVGDFLASTTHFTAEEVGAYVRMLCHQWTQGSIPSGPEDVARICGCQCDRIARVLAKFYDSSPGQLQNRRLEEVRTELLTFQAKKRAAGQVGAAKRWQPHSDGNAMAIANRWPSPSPSVLSQCDRPTLDEVLVKAQFIGLAPWRAEKWWNDLEANGWLTHQGHPMQKWENDLANTKIKWQADGCPTGPPKSKAYSANGATKTKEEKEIEQLRYDIPLLVGNQREQAKKRLQELGGKL